MYTNICIFVSKTVLRVHGQSFTVSLSPRKLRHRRVKKIRSWQEIKLNLCLRLSLTFISYPFSGFLSRKKNVTLADDNVQRGSGNRRKYKHTCLADFWRRISG